MKRDPCPVCAMPDPTLSRFFATPLSSVPVKPERSVAVAGSEPTPSSETAALAVPNASMQVESATARSENINVIPDVLN